MQLVSFFEKKNYFNFHPILDMMTENSELAKPFCQIGSRWTTQPNPPNLWFIGHINLIARNILESLDLINNRINLVITPNFAEKFTVVSISSKH